jgi:hypothetical protein
MEGYVWSDLADYFQRRGLDSADRVVEALDPDCRWIRVRYVGPPSPAPKVDQSLVLPRAATKDVRAGPLAQVHPGWRMEGRKLAELGLGQGHNRRKSRGCSGSGRVGTHNLT